MNVPSWCCTRPHSAFLFSSQTVNKYADHIYLVPLYFLIYFLFPISLFNIAPKCNAEVLFGVPKFKKAAMYLTKKIHRLQKKIHRLDKVHSDMNYSVISYEFSVNEPPIYIKWSIFKNWNTHKTGLYVDWLTKMFWSEACKNLTLLFSRSNSSVFTSPPLSMA